MSSDYRGLLAKIIKDYYLPTKEKSRPIYWLSAFAPQEVVTCFDVDVFYPESHAAVLAPRKAGGKLVSKSSGLGYDDSICSYMRVFASALKYDEPLPFGSIPEPDGLVATNNQCDTLFIMWKQLEKRYGVPRCQLDFPSKSDGDYHLAQMKALVRFMEETTSSSIDEARLKTMVSNSAKSDRLWGQFLDRVYRGKANVALSTIANSFFLPIVVARSREDTASFFKLVAGQFRDGPQPDDTMKRIYWFGYPLWFTREKFPDLREYGAAIVANNYLRWWEIGLKDSSDPLRELARAYSRTYLNRSLDEKLDALMDEVKRYKIDGVIVHSNFSCKRDSITSKKVVEELQNHGVKAMEFQADMCDSNKYQEGRFRLGARTFIESL